MALPQEEMAPRVLGSLIVVLAISYVALVSMSVVNVIASREAADRASSLRTIVGQLEHDYFVLSQGVTEGSGTSLGLTPVSRTDYVHVPGSVGSRDGVRNEI
jgi:hypothetical protein